jgi:hypothetical protein
MTGGKAGISHIVHARAARSDAWCTGRVKSKIKSKISRHVCAAVMPSPGPSPERARVKWTKINLSAVQKKNKDLALPEAPYNFPARSSERAIFFTKILIAPILIFDSLHIQTIE